MPKLKNSEIAPPALAAELLAGIHKLDAERRAAQVEAARLVTETRGAWVLAVQDAAAQGLSIRAIATDLGIDNTTIRDLIRRHTNAQGAEVTT